MLAKGPSYYCICNLFAKRNCVFQAYLLALLIIVLILYNNYLFLQLVVLQYFPLRFQHKDGIITKCVLISVTVYYLIGVGMKQQAATERYQAGFQIQVIMIQVHLFNQDAVFFIWSINEQTFQRNLEDLSA